MNTEKSLSLANISLALVYDKPEKLERTAEHPFPAEAEAEWETAETIEKIASTWEQLGCVVTRLALDNFFLSRWSEHFQKFDLVHSLVEGWGTPAREAWIPALCEMSGVPFIGSDPFAQCVAMRKSTFKLLCRNHGIPTPEFHLVRCEEDIHKIPAALLSRPHFIKPDCEGSGMGIDAQHSIGTSAEQSRQTCRSLLIQFPEGVLIEEHLSGQELTSAFIGSNPTLTLPIAEIEVPDGVYGLANKSKDAMEEKVTFPELGELQRNIILKSMSTLQKQIGLDDFVRFDWKLNDEGIPMLLEANPLAGLSYYYSVLPKMAEAGGLNYGALLEKIALSALSRKNDRRYWYGRARLKTKKGVHTGHPFP
jgi:D-alanine-D-alanine ligase